MKYPLASIFGQGFWYAVGNAAGKAGGLLLLPIFTNAAYLAPESYGLWGVFEVTVQISIVIVGLQLGLAVVRFHAEEDVRQEAQTSAWWALAALVAGGFALGATLSARLMAPPWSTIYAALFAYIAAETLLTIPLSILRAMGRARSYTVLLVLRLSLVFVLTLWLLVGRQMGLMGVVVAYAGASTATLFVAIPLSSGVRLIRPRMDPALLRRMLRFSLPLVLAGIGSIALNAADRYILLGLRSAEEVALYTLAVKFGGVVNMFAAQPLQLALLPVLFQIAADQRVWLVQTLTRLSTLAFGLLTVILVLFTAPVLTLIGADPFYQQATHLVVWVALGFGLFGLSIIYDGVLILFKKTGRTSFWFTVAAVANILLNLAIIPWLGALGAAITTLVSYAVLLAGRVWATRDLLQVPQRSGRLFGIAGITVAVSVAEAVITIPEGTAGLLMRTALLATWGLVVLAAGWVGAKDLKAALRLVRRR